MMNSPSMYSVDQLLKARQNGVPDYVVVPMLQKAMAQKQASQQQAALQGGANSPPPVADQILGAAQHSVMQDHMARQEPESRGIDALPSGIDEGDYKQGGIIAFAEGGDVYPEYDGSAYKSQYSAEDLNPDDVSKAHDLRIGVDPSVAEDRARILSKESALKDDKDTAMWTALMKAGLSTMGGKSPNALANISEGATAGLESYAADKKGIAEERSKLDMLRSQLNAADRAAHVASVTFGESSVQARKAENNKNAIAGAVAKAKHDEDVAKFRVDSEGNDIKREQIASSAASSAANRAQSEKHFNATQAKGTNPMNANQTSDMLSDLLKSLSVEEEKIIANDDLSSEEKEYALANIKGVRHGYQREQLNVSAGKPVNTEYLIALRNAKDTPYNSQQVAPPTPKPVPGFTITKNK
jgi:hypothetical protein